MSTASTKKRGRAERAPLLIDLALQGGGAHGAYTWGVLDRLLEESWLRIDGISGTSAGAMNAAALVYGHSLDGNEGARRLLEGFWRRVSQAAELSPIRRGPLDVFLNRWTLDNSLAYIATDLMSRLFSPYDLNLTGWNPLRKLLTEGVDYDRVAQSPIRIFITATNVATGRARVFRNHEITPDVLLASACLPTMFQAVEIDGEAYWDGGYSGNPDHHAPDTRMQVARYDHHSHQSSRAQRRTPCGERDSQPPQRGGLQCRSAEGIAHDRVVAACRQYRRQGGRAMGQDARP
jgi:NTE family protein